MHSKITFIIEKNICTLKHTKRPLDKSRQRRKRELGEIPTARPLSTLQLS